MYCEMTRFACGHGGSARWGRIVGVCRKCKKEVRRRQCRPQFRGVDWPLIHRCDGGVVDMTEAQAGPQEVS